MPPSLLTWRTGCRCFSVSASCLKSFGKTGRGKGGTNLRERDMPRFLAKRERVFMAMMHKKFGIETANDDLTLLLEPGSSGRARQLNPKKRKQLSVVFGEKIVEALEEEPSMSGFSINISKIDVARDLQLITVFWMCKGDENDDLIDKALSEAAPKIRTRLLTHQIVGAMPAIKFVRDMSDLHLEEMNRIFATADYGMDYRAVSQTAATLSPLSNSAPSSYAPPWLQRMKDKKQQRTDEVIHSDASLPKSE